MFGPLARTSLALFVGALAGLHVATWGMYKDALYEGFSARKYARSVIVGALAAALLQLTLAFNLATGGGLLLLFALTYTLERGLVESWKSFLRDEDQSKYFIPMAFAVNGRVVVDRLTRRLAGAAYVLALALVAVGLSALQPSGGARPSVAALLLVGTAGGWISAFGGAWKDAPKEGFQLLKFFRSPGLSLAYAVLLAQLTPSYLCVAFGALGLTIATIETHKKFDRPRTAPGKFSGKPVTHPAMFRHRRLAVPVYAAIWAVLLAAVAASLVEAGLLQVSPALAEVLHG